MDQDFEYFQTFCSLIDYRLMKTVNDDTVSDPKPRLKKKAKDIRKREELDEEAGPTAPQPKKEYKLEKSRKRKDTSDQTNPEEQQPQEPEAKNLKFNRKTGKFVEKPKFQKSDDKNRKFQKSEDKNRKFHKGEEKGRKFEKKFDKTNRKQFQQKTKKGKPEWRD